MEPLLSTYLQSDRFSLKGELTRRLLVTTCPPYGGTPEGRHTATAFKRTEVLQYVGVKQKYHKVTQKRLRGTRRIIYDSALSMILCIKVIRLSFLILQLKAQKYVYKVF